MITPHIILTNVGLKASCYVAQAPDCYAIPKAHFYIDCRGIKDGLSPLQVGHWLEEQGYVLGSIIIDSILSAVAMIEARRKGQSDVNAPFVITFLCAYGQNRSKGAKEWAAQWIAKYRPEWKVEVK